MIRFLIGTLLALLFLGVTPYGAFAESSAPKAPAPGKGDEMKAYCQKYPKSLECKPRDVNSKLEEAQKRAQGLENVMPEFQAAT